MATVSGWGDTTGDPNFPRYLYKVQLKVLNGKACDDTEGFDRNTMICAGNEGKM